MSSSTSSASENDSEADSKFSFSSPRETNTCRQTFERFENTIHESYCERSCCKYVSWIPSQSEYNDLVLQNGFMGSTVTGSSSQDIIKTLLSSASVSQKEILRMMEESRKHVPMVGREKLVSRFDIDEKFSISFTKKSGVPKNLQKVCLKTYLNGLQNSSSVVKHASHHCPVNGEMTQETPITRIYERSEAVDMAVSPKLRVQSSSGRKEDPENSCEGASLRAAQLKVPSATQSDFSEHENSNLNLPNWTDNLVTTGLPIDCSIQPHGTTPQDLVKLDPGSKILAPMQSSVVHPTDKNGQGSAPKPGQSGAAVKPSSMQEEIPFFTIKEPQSDNHNGSYKTITKLFACDFYQLQGTFRENHFLLYSEIVHKVDIFGTITMIQHRGPNKAAYTVDDGTSSISCIHNFSKELDKKAECKNWLKKADSKRTVNFDQSNVLTISELSIMHHADELNTDEESAISGMRSVARRSLESLESLESGVGKSPFKIGDTIHGVGVLFDYRSEKNICLNKIRKVISIVEEEDRIHQMIISYRSVYPKVIKDFKSSVIPAI